MNAENMATMKKKLGFGQVRRNNPGGKDAFLAFKSKTGGTAVAFFKSSVYVGAQVRIFQQHAIFPGTDSPAENPKLQRSRPGEQ